MRALPRQTQLSLLAAVALCACAPDLRVDHPFDGNGKCVDPTTKQEVDCATIPLLTVTLSGMARDAILDATNKTSQVFVDLDGDRELKSDAAFETNSWDLAFKRFEISTNGGAGNPGGVVEVAVLKGVDYETLTKAPAEGYQQDGKDAVFASVEGGWYFYDLGVHRLVTKQELTYVVHTSSGAYMKLKMGDYYDASGTPAMMAFRYQAIEAP